MSWRVSSNTGDPAGVDPWPSLDDEIADRIAGDTALSAAVAAETSARQAADAVQQAAIDALEATDTRIKTVARDLYRPFNNALMPQARASVAIDEGIPPWALIANGGYIRWDEADHFTYAGATQAINGDPNLGMYPYAGPADRATPVDMEFIYTGRRFAWHFLSYNFLQRCQIWIDNQPVVIDQFDISTAYASPFITVDFGAKTVARVRIAGPQAFRQILKDSVHDTVLPVPSRFTLGVVSDSYFCLNNQQFALSPAAHLGTVTGWRIHNLAQGGTGYIATGAAPGGRNFDHADRLAEIAAGNFDALLVNGSGNDGAVVDGAAYKAAALDFYADMAAITPSLPIIVVGVEPTSNFRGAHALDMNNGLEEAANEAPNVVKFINAYDEAWFTGTGSTDNLVGNGNQDWLVGNDDTHQSPQGGKWYAELIADRMADAVLEVTP